MTNIDTLRTGRIGKNNARNNAMAFNKDIPNHPIVKISRTDATRKRSTLTNIGGQEHQFIQKYKDT